MKKINNDIKEAEKEYEGLRESKFTLCLPIKENSAEKNLERSFQMDCNTEIKSIGAKLKNSGNVNLFFVNKKTENRPECFDLRHVNQNLKGMQKNGGEVSFMDNKFDCKQSETMEIEGNRGRVNRMEDKNRNDISEELNSSEDQASYSLVKAKGKTKGKSKKNSQEEKISYLLYNRENPESVLTAMLGLLKLKRRGTKIHQRKNFFQTKALQEMYLVTQYPDKRIKDYLSLLLNMELKVINIWFQNKRNAYIQNVKNNICTEDMFEPDKKLSVQTNMRLTLKAVSDIIIQSLDPLTQMEYIKLLK